jgi:hypothetical protein
MLKNLFDKVKSIGKIKMMYIMIKEQEIILILNIDIHIWSIKRFLKIIGSNLVRSAITIIFLCISRKGSAVSIKALI